MTDPAAVVFAVLFVLPGYAIGSISSGYLVGKAYRNVDLRRVGSGSTGATNTLRALGPGAALLVALLDIAKGVAAPLLALAFVPGPPEITALAQGAAAVGALAGHAWPMLLERGGRGVATGFGALLIVATEAWAVAVIGFVLGLALTRIVSVASLSAIAGAFGGYVLLVAFGRLTPYLGVAAFVAIGCFIVVYRHRDNISRLIRGVEPRLGRP